MTKRLFNEFDSVSSKQWKQKIQFDLKGADYNNKLVWKTNEDILVKPFYHADDFPETLKPLNTKTTEWKICQSIFVAHVEKSNLKAINAIKKGADSIKFIIPSEDVSIEDLLENIDLNITSIHFELQFLSPDFIKKNALISAKAKVYYHTDIIENLAKTGNWFNNIKDDFSQFESIVATTKCFSINAALYQNSGATIVQQLGYALAHANEYLNYIDATINNEEKETISINFNIAVGSNYFFEIAKLRYEPPQNA